MPASESIIIFKVCCCLVIYFFTLSPDICVFMHCMTVWSEQALHPCGGCWHMKHLRETYPMCSWFLTLNCKSPLCQSAGVWRRAAADRLNRNVCQDDICDQLEGDQAGANGPLWAAGPKREALTLFCQYHTHLCSVRRYSDVSVTVAC